MFDHLLGMRFVIFLADGFGGKGRQFIGQQVVYRWDILPTMVSMEKYGVDAASSGRTRVNNLAFLLSERFTPSPLMTV
jgi:hypothetical protein